MRVAITGGIGSGKSEVLNILSSLNQKVISCDEINKSLLSSKEYLSKLENTFAGVVVNGKLDKKALSNIVFDDKSKLQLLNEIAHPIIRKIALDLSKSEDITFVEVPLLFESNMENDYDKVILVSASENVRIKRASLRDNKTEEEIKKVINNQIKSYKNKHIDYIIDNSSTLDVLKDNVLMVLNKIKQN